MIAQGRHAEALPIVTRGDERSNAPADERAPRLALVNYSMVNRGLGRMAEAEATSRRALTILQGVGSRARPRRRCHDALGRRSQAQGKNDDASRCSAAPWKPTERGMGPDYPDSPGPATASPTRMLAQGTIDERARRDPRRHPGAAPAQRRGQRRARAGGDRRAARASARSSSITSVSPTR